MHWMNWFGGGWLMMIFWLILIIGGVVFAVKWLSDSGAQMQKDDSALEILKKRYARGEISKKEFEEKKGGLI